jgi:hydroxypyruvate isomerase
VNTRVDHPGVLFSRTEDLYGVAARSIRHGSRSSTTFITPSPKAKTPARSLPQIAGTIGHVQVADSPGRGEPGSGRIDWNDKLTQLQQSGYAGVIGVECHPTKASTADALQYFVGLCGRHA